MAAKSLPLESYELASPPASGSKLVNCFIEQLPEDAKTPLLLSRAPGVRDFTTVGNGPIYGALEFRDTAYVVSGTKLYSVDDAGTATELGDIGSINANGIDMDNNATTVVVVNEPDAYYYDTTTSTFGQITDADFTSRGASDVEFVDNWLLFLEPGSGRFFGADIGTATSFDALNFATAEASPDDSVGFKVDHRQPVIFGKRSVEIWDNTGVAGFPFERAINGYVELGCFSGRSIAKVDNSLMWLANDYTVRRLDGVTPVRVSHHGVEQSLRETTVTSAKAFSYTQGGHLFYVLSTPEITWVYDATTRKWHNRQSYGYDAWNIGAHCQAFGYELVGSSTNNKLGILDTETYTEWGATQVASWRYQTIYAENRRAMHDRFEVVMETGVGLTSGQGSAPELMLEKSDDGGMTWESLPNKSIGPIGSYSKRVVWNRLGSARQRAYRASISDPVKMFVTDTIVDVRGGAWH